ncbi:MAG: hypothetical protein HY960_09770 [Ignavibacteriae bacterium]|nr:hypothetical protein [Ignavibacteriota bacterium]
MFDSKIKTLILFIFASVFLLALNSCEEEPENLNDTKPFVSIVSPGRSSYILTDTTVVIEAWDDVGITRVELYLNHKLDSSRVFTESPYRWFMPIDSLRDSIAYLLYAKAYDVEGNITKSQPIAFTVSKFLAPQNPTIHYITKDSLELRWEDKTKWEKNFEVEMSNDGVNYSVIQSLKANKIKTTVYGQFRHSLEYYFRIRGIRDTIVSPYSKTLKVYYGPDGENLFAGGSFDYAGGKVAKYFAHFDAEKWSAVTSSVNDRILAMASFNGELYVGGVFTKAGDTAASYIARWDGSTWNKVGDGFNGRVFALKVYNGELYAGGLFTQTETGSATFNYVARWNGSQWRPVGSGFSYAVYALEEYKGDLIAAGEFSRAGTELVNRIAKWDGEAWSRLDLGLDRKVLALAVYNEELFAGGLFQTAGSDEAKYIASWNGSRWMSVGDGFDADVWSLTVFNNELYAGGGFMKSGSTNTKRIARWSGSTWFPVGDGIDPEKTGASYVYAFTRFNGGLYAGGDFDFAGKAESKNLARWNGVTWDEAGGGTNNVVYSLATYKADSWKWILQP